MSKISAIVTLRAQPGRGDDVVAAFEAARPALADEVGTLHFVLHRDSSDPDVLYLSEIYADQAAFDAHVAGPVMGTVMGVSEMLVENGFTLALTTPVAELKG